MIGSNLPQTILFEYGTIRELAAAFGDSAVGNAVVLSSKQVFCELRTRSVSNLANNLFLANVRRRCFVRCKICRCSMNPHLSRVPWRVGLVGCLRTLGACSTRAVTHSVRFHCSGGTCIAPRQTTSARRSSTAFVMAALSAVQNAFQTRRLASHTWKLPRWTRSNGLCWSWATCSSAAQAHDAPSFRAATPACTLGS